VSVKMENKIIIENLTKSKFSSIYSVDKIGGSKEKDALICAHFILHFFNFTDEDLPKRIKKLTIQKSSTGFIKLTGEKLDLPKPIKFYQINWNFSKADKEHDRKIKEQEFDNSLYLELSRRIDVLIPKGKKSICVDVYIEGWE